MSKSASKQMQYPGREMIAIVAGNAKGWTESRNVSGIERIGLGVGLDVVCGCGTEKLGVLFQVYAINRPFTGLGNTDKETCCDNGYRELQIMFQL